MKTLEINGEFFSVNEGEFDSRDRFVRQPASSGHVDFWMTQGANMRVKVEKFSGGWTVYWRWECGPLSVTPFSPYTNAAAPPAGFAVDRGGAF